MQKGKKIEMLLSSMETHCRKFQCSMLNIQQVIQGKQGVQFFTTNCNCMTHKKIQKGGIVFLNGGILVCQGWNFGKNGDWVVGGISDPYPGNYID